MPTTLTLRTAPHPLAIGRTPVAQPLLGALVTDANRLLLRGVETLERWGARHGQRRALLSLSDHLLHDIGRSRADAEAEGGKPFWRD
ncbi:MAG TPA: DUF1127 domain-containing protein [Microvirga sp.]|jgi:uncharacterized protein YjiS (DUF1127 family)|nr:DUF1127 domain-containing protein [Microvirga sp.]